MPVQIENVVDLGAAVRRARRSCGLRQEDVALAAGTGVRFVVDLERGKPTAQIAETLRVLHVVGLHVELAGPGLDGDA
jgi:y4mF family transcriptional regulator